ncbi:MAG: S41 family peptidase [Pseudomonadota bacterium]
MKRLVLTAFAAGALAIGLAAATQADNASKTFRRFDKLVDVFERVRAEYVEPVDEDKLIEAAISGMLSSLDPHSSYMPPDSFRAMQVQTDGEFGGLGIEVQMENGLVKVVSPIDDTPAARAGIEGGDLIIQIDGEQVYGLSLQEALDKMRGPVGAPITVTILREGKDEPFDVTIVRDMIKLRAVRARVEDGSVGYVRISTFNRQASDGLEEAVADLRKQLDGRMTGLILDLRGNPGGLLDQAVGVADAFLDHGEIVSTRGRRKADIDRRAARPGDVIDGLPLIVLVNAYSASASEIVAGALQDHRRAVVLGTQTFGKGTVQTVIPLAGEAAMRLTTARYYTPSGRSIQEYGIKPDIEVKQPRPAGAEEEDETPSSPRREADLRNHLSNEHSPAGQTNLEVKDAPLAPREVVPTSVDTEDAKDYQLGYALSLMRGIAQQKAQLALN